MRILVVAKNNDATLLINQMLDGLIDNNYLSYVDQFRAGGVSLLIATVDVEPAIDIGSVRPVLHYRPSFEFLSKTAHTRGGQPGAIVIMTTENPAKLKSSITTKSYSSRTTTFFQSTSICPTARS